jgi:hypothetical protein
MLAKTDPREERAEARMRQALACARRVVAPKATALNTHVGG